MLADKLMMPVDSEDFESLLEQWPADQKWDETDVTQARFKLAGLDRYNMDLKLTFKDVSVTNAY